MWKESRFRLAIDTTGYLLSFALLAIRLISSHYNCLPTLHWGSIVFLLLNSRHALSMTKQKQKRSVHCSYLKVYDSLILHLPSLRLYKILTEGYCIRFEIFCKAQHKSTFVRKTLLYSNISTFYRSSSDSPYWNFKGMSCGQKFKKIVSWLTNVFHPRQMLSFPWFF